MMKKVSLLPTALKYLSCLAFASAMLTSCKQTDKNFSLAYIDGITSVVISQDSFTATLAKAKENNIWMVDGSYEVGEEQLDMLLYIINTQLVASQIPKEQAELASAILKNEGINLKVYEENKVVLDITVAANDSLGYFGRSEDNEELYRLNLPDVPDSPLSFLSANPSFWKHNAIITALPSEINSVTIDNLEDPEKSLRIARQADGSLSLFDIYNNEEVANVDQKKLHTYLSYFTGLSYEKLLATEQIEHQAILLSDSPYKLTIAINGAEPIALHLFYITGNENLDAFGNALKYDPNQLYLSMNNDRDIALAKWISFDLLLRDLEYFVEN